MTDTQTKRKVKRQSWGAQEVSLAIYSCNITSIGRTTHQAGTGGAHIRYIARPDANPVLMAQNMPDDPLEARNWLDRQERGMRKNARVLDKLRIALPKELTEDQRYSLVEEFMTDLTENQIPWYAAIHQSGKDERNPHVHIALHDRSVKSNRRLLRLSDSTRDRIKDGLPGPKAIDWVRERWEIVCNQALEEHGYEARIDRRTLEAQGIDREPTIHEGPRAQHIDGNVRRPESKPKINGCGRVIDYPKIDKGKTRREFNAHIIDLNLERAARSDNPVAAAWAQFEREQFYLDRRLEFKLAKDQRRRTGELRTASAYFEAKHKRITAEWRLKRKAFAKQHQDNLTKDRARLRSSQLIERELLKAKQGKLYARIWALLDFTGSAHRKNELARKELSKRHKSQRADLTSKYQLAKGQKLSTLKNRYLPSLNQVKEQRIKKLKAIEGTHKVDEYQADHKRQTREAEREQSRLLTESKIVSWKKELKNSRSGTALEGQEIPYVTRTKTGKEFNERSNQGATDSRSKAETDIDISDKFKNRASKNVNSPDDLTTRKPSRTGGRGRDSGRQR